MSEPRLLVALAQDASEVRAAQRLRWQVFAEEMGARLQTPLPGHDVDRWDAHCAHLLVRCAATGEVVGTYRLLGADAAQRAGGSCTEQAFELGRIGAGRSRLLELGRCCVRADHRRGAVIGLLWSGLARYLHLHPHDHLIGCASIRLGDPDFDAVAICQALRGTSGGADQAWRATPRRPLPLPGFGAPTVPGALPLRSDPTLSDTLRLPPLLKGYLRAGALPCGAPAFDPDFQTADLPMLLELARLNPAHARHFLRA